MRKILLLLLFMLTSCAYFPINPESESNCADGVILVNAPKQAESYINRACSYFQDRTGRSVGNKLRGSEIRFLSPWEPWDVCSELSKKNKIRGCASSLGVSELRLGVKTWPKTLQHEVIHLILYNEGMMYGHHQWMIDNRLCWGNCRPTVDDPRVIFN